MTGSDIVQLILGVLAIIFGGGLFKGYWALKKKHKEDIAEIRDKFEKCHKESDDQRHRIISLELESNRTGFPSWRKNQKGVYVDVNPEYTQRILVPLGLTAADIKGRTDNEIAEFSLELKTILKELDEKATFYPFATAHGVRFHEHTSPMTIIKRSVTDRISGEVYFLGLACPEF